MKIRAVLLVTLLLLSLTPAFAGTHTAASCSADALQAAFRSAESDTAPVVVTPMASEYVGLTKQVTFTAPANTLVSWNCLARDDFQSSDPLLVIVTHAQGRFQIHGLDIKGGASGGQVKYGGVVSISGQSKSFEMARAHINAQSYAPLGPAAAVRFTGHVTGVIHHSIIDNHSTGNGVQVWYNGYGGASDVGDASWAAPTGFGTSDFLFIEDTVFNSNSIYGSATDCIQGGKIVFRRNVVNGPMIQTHATTSGAGRGCRATEFYDNIFKGSADTPANTVFWHDSGPALGFRNNASGYVNFQTLYSRRRSDDGTGGHAQDPPPIGYGYAGTSFNGVSSNWDGNENPVNGYPNLDQPGRGKGDLLRGWFPNMINATTGCDPSKPCAWPRQALEPIYQWMNNFTPAPNWGGVILSGGDVFVANRDYYLYTSSFTGAFGVGSGMLAARPATCTARVGYWATDTNTLYTCASANNWAPSYKPYPYPHDLAGGTPIPPIPPIPPQPQPPANVAPTITFKSPTANGQIILTKSFTISATLGDDVECNCVAWAELYIAGVLAKPRTLSVQSLSFTWNTSPYKGKGLVEVAIVSGDAEGLTRRETRKVTVPK